MDNFRENLVFIFAYECAPYNRKGSTMGAQRPYQLGKNLAEFGWKVVVFCADVNRRSELSPRSDWQTAVRNETAQLKEKHASTTIIPLPCLEYSSLVDRCWRKTIRFNKESGTIIPKQGLISSLFRKVLTFCKYFSGDHSENWQPVAERAARDLMERGYRPNILIAEHGPDAGLFIAAKLSKKYQISWIADCRDPLLMGFPRSTKWIVRSFYRNILLKSAAALVNVNPIWVEREAELFEKPVHLVTNGYDPEEAPQELGLTSKVNLEREGISILFYGNFYPCQDLESFLKELKQVIALDAFFESISLHYFGSACHHVRILAEKYDLTTTLKARKFIPREELFYLAKQVDLLLLLSVNPNKEGLDKDFEAGFYPGKVFEYFGLRKPILCFPGDESILSNLIMETDSGFVVKQGELKDFLLSFRSLSESLTFKTKLYSHYQQSLKLSEVLQQYI